MLKHPPDHEFADTASYDSPLKRHLTQGMNMAHTINDHLIMAFTDYTAKDNRRGRKRMAWGCIAQLPCGRILCLSGALENGPLGEQRAQARAREALQEHGLLVAQYTDDLSGSKRQGIFWLSRDHPMMNRAHQLARAQLAQHQGVKARGVGKKRNAIIRNSYQLSAEEQQSIVELRQNLIENTIQAHGIQYLRTLCSSTVDHQYHSTLETLPEEIAPHDRLPQLLAEWENDDLNNLNSCLSLRIALIHELYQQEQIMEAMSVMFSPEQACLTREQQELLDAYLQRKATATSITLKVLNRIETLYLEIDEALQITDPLPFMRACRFLEWMDSQGYHEEITVLNNWRISRVTELLGLPEESA